MADFEKAIETSVENAVVKIKCTCLLHNIVRDKDGNSDPVYREIRFNVRHGGNVYRRNNSCSARAQQVRDKFANYLKTQRLTPANYIA